MATRRIFEQLKPAATVTTTIYTVPQGNYSIIKGLNICNLSNANSAYALSIVKSGESDDDKQFLYKETVCPGKDANRDVDFNDLLLEGGDAIKVNSTLGNLSFSVWGEETGII